jgi:hypothetical protein
MYAELKKDDASLQKKSSDRHRESSSNVDRTSDLLSGEITEGFTRSPSHALPSPGQGQLVMQCKGLSNQAEPKPVQGPLIQRKAHGTGLPDKLKTGIEQLSGYPMDDVTVHYNSHKPAQQQAHAYTQGTAIHVAPGQEQHLPHEAWHAVQQKQGRVKPTLQMKGMGTINDDAGLEREADVMGAKALQIPSSAGHRPVAEGGALQAPCHTAASDQGTIQKFDWWRPFRRRRHQTRPPGGHVNLRFAGADNPRYQGNRRPQLQPRPRPQDRRHQPIRPADVLRLDNVQPQPQPQLQPQPQPQPQLPHHRPVNQPRNAPPSVDSNRPDLMSNAELNNLKSNESPDNRLRFEKTYEAVERRYYPWRLTVKNEDPVVKLYFLERLLKTTKDFLQRTKTKSNFFLTVKENIETVLASVQAEYQEKYPQDRPPRLESVDLPFNLDRFPAVENSKAGLKVGINANTERVIMNENEDHGVFKPEIDKDEHYGETRGAPAGIPEMNPNQTGRSVAAYRIDQLLGAGIIPATYRAKKGDNTGSVMAFIEGAEDARIPGQEFFGNFKPEHHRERNNLYLMDVITGQVDRHFGNILIKGSKVWAIDNDMAFGKNVSFDQKTGAVVAKLPGPGRQPKDLAIDKAFAIKIINLARHPQWVEEALLGLIDDEEIAKTIERLQGLAAYLLKRIALYDNVRNEGE